jgi:hypothetical protein
MDKNNCFTFLPGFLVYTMQFSLGKPNIKKRERLHGNQQQTVLLQYCLPTLTFAPKNRNIVRMVFTFNHSPSAMLPNQV